MRLIALFFVSAKLLAAGSASAQAPASAPASQWGWGIRIGVGPGSTPYGDSRRDYRQTYTGAVGGLLATRYVAGLKASLGLEALAENQSVHLDFQQATPYPNYRPLTLAQWRLFVPLYLRTGTPANRLHLLAGAGPTLPLGPSDSDAAYYPRRAELTGLLGVEVRLTPWHRYETTLGLRVHIPLTPSYAYGYPDGYTNQGVSVTYEARRDGFTHWFGFTLGTTFYPAAGSTL